MFEWKTHKRHLITISWSTKAPSIIQYVLARCKSTVWPQKKAYQPFFFAIAFLVNYFHRIEFYRIELCSIALTAYVFLLLFSDSIMVKVIEIRRSRDSKILHYCTNCNCNASRNLLELLCEKFAIHQLFLGGKNYRYKMSQHESCAHFKWFLWLEH